MNDHLRRMVRATPDAGDHQSLFVPQAAPVRRIEYRFVSGVRLSLPYALLVDLSFRPSDGAPSEGGGREFIEMDFNSKWFVKVTGRNLSELFDALNEHTVPWLAEAVRAREGTVPFTVFIERIEASKLTDPKVAMAQLEKSRRVVAESPLPN